MIDGLLPPRAGGAAVLDVDVALADAERAGGQHDDLLAHVVAGHQRGGAGIDRLAAGERADALRDRGGVARGHDDVLHAAADPVGDDLRQRRARALALRCGAGRDRDLAVGQDAHGDALERPEPRALDVIADADADIAAFARAPWPGARESSS